MLYIPKISNFLKTNEKRKRFYGVKEFSTNSSSLVISLPNQYWNLNETNGIRSNSVVGGYNLALGYNKDVDSLAGKISNAANFEGSNSEYLQCADAVACGGINTFSASCWIYASNVVTEQHIIGKWEPALDGREWALLIISGVVHFFTSADGTSGDMHNVSTDSISINTWYFITVTYNNGIKKIYKNGTLIQTAPEGVNIHNTVHPFTVGSGEQADSQIPYTGRIDEVGYWNIALTQDEITELYNGGAGKTFNGTLWV